MKTSLSQMIVRAWELRFNQRIEECLGLLSEVKQKMGFPSGLLSKSDIAQIVQSASTNLVTAAEILCLCSSLSRAQGNLEYSRFLIHEVEEQLRLRDALDHYSFRLEKGLAAFSQGDSFAAMEDFLRASHLSRNELEKLVSLGNALLCMENLGLPFDKTLEQVCGHIENLEKKGEPMPALKAQIEALKLRDHFRNGRLSQIFPVAKKISPQETSMTQSQYFRLWVHELPYHHYSRWSVQESHLAISNSESLIGSHFFYQRSFRVRTLQGILHPDDLHSTKPSELIDRLYLWVWRWLMDPGRFSIQRILSLLEVMDLPSLSHRVSAEDTDLLRNALLWLSLFDPASGTALVSSVEALRHSSPESKLPLLELENGVVQYFLALRNRKELLAEDLLSSLKSHPLWNSSDLYFKALVNRDSVMWKEGHVLFQNINLLLAQNKKVLSRVRVNMRTFQITESGSKKSILSAPLALGLELLHDRGSVSCEEFTAICFGLPRYDPLIHNSRIFNLLARIRKIVPPSIRLGMKSDFVVVQGSWDKGNGIEFLRNDLFSRTLATEPLWKAFVHRCSKVRSSKSQNLKSAELTPSAASVLKVLNRREVEALLGRTRSTANRLLGQWMREGLIKKEGHARNTRYFLSEKLRARLAQGEIPS